VGSRQLGVQFSGASEQRQRPTDIGQPATPSTTRASERRAEDPCLGGHRAHGAPARSRGGEETTGPPVARPDNQTPLSEDLSCLVGERRP